MPQFVCPLCARPLCEGPSLRFQGDVFVHAPVGTPFESRSARRAKLQM
jgi:hypothetical protein